MKVVVAIDSLKDSLTSYEAGKAVEKGIYKAYEDEEVEVVVKTLADGGEGTVDAFVEGMQGEKRKVTVNGPLMEPVSCAYGYLEESHIAIIEMAGAAGIGLIAEERRNPLETTTYGVGEVIKKAIEEGVRQFSIGSGGSVTNDCGVGMLQALGYEFLDQEGKPVGKGGKVLSQIVTIKEDKIIKGLKECHFKVACDVTNPLCGPNGASYIYGPQKGATSEMVEQLDEGCRHFAATVKAHYGKDYRDVQGAGAAGGMGYGFLSFLNSELKSGIQIILEEIKLAEDLKYADFVITGEGGLDGQTAMGKAPIGIAKLAKNYGVKVIAFAGCTTEEATACNIAGIDAYFSIVNGAMSLKEAMRRETAEKNMTQTAEQVFRLIRTLA